jgi:VanZ family protein
MSIKWFVPALVWFVISFTLLVLPGNDLPHNDFFNIPYFDKWVHTGMFFLLSSLFSLPFTQSNFNVRTVREWFVRVAILVIVYGIAMEFVQKYFTVGRSFDVIDIIFDTIGSFLGWSAISIFYGKKIGPDGNRGRNQN